MIINEMITKIDRLSFDKKSLKSEFRLNKKFELIAFEILNFVHTFKDI